MATGTNAIATRTNANSKKSGAYTSDLSRCVTQRSAFSAGFSGFVTTEGWGTWTLSYNKVNIITPTPGLSKTTAGKIFTLKTISGNGTDGQVGANSVTISIKFSNAGQTTLASTSVKVYVVIRVMGESNNVIASKSVNATLTSGSLSASASVTRTRTLSIPAFNFEGNNNIDRVEVVVYNGMLPADVSGSAIWMVTASTSSTCAIRYFDGQRLAKYSSL